MHQFINSSDYFGGIVVEVSGLKSEVKELSVKNKLKIVISIATKIANTIDTEFGDYRGTHSFVREPIKKYFRNKKLSFSIGEGSNAEIGKPTMRSDIDPNMFVDLKDADWYAYNENYGTSEEKFLVKYFESQMDHLKNRFSDIYLLRNERFFKIYRFNDGKALEPDFVLFLTEKGSDKEIVYQLFIEPKGEHLLATDSWKEDFLIDIEENAKIEIYQSKQYRLIGMPFYNKNIKEDVFDRKLNSI
jgi:type III restriction enzyme